MATRIALDDAVDLDLPGRRSRDILASVDDAQSTFRIVEIAVPEPGADPRPPHWHPDSEECIYVLSGQGSTWVDGQEFAMRSGDTLYIAPGERHVTRNCSDIPLTLLCFFPSSQITLLTESHVDLR